ncbi:hypothetical protein Btru_008811 [Bulinus truncatus]|nr:hypothetical protein Btru_008811 [Bulinus truncatus]
MSSASVLSVITMHDPKLSASMAQQHMLISESFVDSLSGHGILRPHYHVTSEPYEPSKMSVLSRALPGQGSEDVPERISHHLSFLQRMKELEVGVARAAGSVFTDLSSHYSYADLLYARSLYGALRSDAGLLPPLSSATFSDRFLGGGLGYPGRHGPPTAAAPGVVIKDYPHPPSLVASSVPTSSSRACDTLSLSPLHVSTTLASISPSSSLSSLSPHRQSSVSPDSSSDPQHYSRRHLKHTPSINRAPLTLYEDRLPPADRGLGGLGLSFSHHRPWQTHSSNLVFRPGLPVFEPLVTSLDSRSKVGHLLEHYLPSSSSLLVQNHFHRTHQIKEPLYNGLHSSHSDTRSSPGKELTTKTWKQDRTRERQELSGALEADREHTERLSHVKKSASTQTQCSSFSCENQPPPIYFSHDTITHDRLRATLPPPAYPLPPPPLIQYTAQLPPPPPLHHPVPPPSLLTHPNRHLLLHAEPAALPPTVPPMAQLKSSPPMTPLSLPAYHSCTPPPQYGEHTGSPADVQHAPLNLSLSSAPLINPVTATGKSSNKVAPDNTNRQSNETNRVTPNAKNGSRNDETSAQVADEAIEEHFRRSLGKCYTEPSPAKKMTVHVSEKICSVDDHFARALGDQMWTEIKARSEPSGDPSTVDAHFAKALGASMWKKLKAENKLVDELHSGSPTQQHPPSSTSSLQTSLAT